MDWPRGRAPHLLLDDNLPTTVLLVREQPNLAKVVPGIIHAIEGGAGLPEEIVDESGKNNPLKVVDDIDRATFLRECGDRLHTWRMLYCGGAKPVSDALTAISKDLGISFRKESFAW